METVGQIQRDFGDYAPAAFPMDLLSSSQITDQTAYQMARFWRDVTANNFRAASHRSPKNEPSGENEMLSLRLQYKGDSVQLVNTHTGGVEALFSMQPDGLFSYHGPRKYAILLGGRGELGDFLPKLMQNYKSLSDRDLLRDRGTEHKTK